MQVLLSLRSVSGTVMSFSVVAGLSCGQVILVEVERRIFCRDAVSMVPPCPSGVAGPSYGQVILVEVKRRLFVSLRSASGAAMSLAAVASPCCPGHSRRSQAHVLLSLLTSLQFRDIQVVELTINFCTIRLHPCSALILSTFVVYAASVSQALHPILAYPRGPGPSCFTALTHSSFVNP